MQDRIQQDSMRAARLGWIPYMQDSEGLHGWVEWRTGRIGGHDACYYECRTGVNS